VVTNLRISGMSCNHCVQTVARALRGVAGVSEVEVSLPDRARVTHDRASDAALTTAVQSAGYEATVE